MPYFNKKETRHLDTFYLELWNIHKRCFPQWRFGQFIMNVFEAYNMRRKNRDPYFASDKELLEFIKRYPQKCEARQNPPEIWHEPRKGSSLDYPEIDKDVLICLNNGTMRVGRWHYRSEKTRYWQIRCVRNHYVKILNRQVDAWMELPERYYHE